MSTARKVETMDGMPWTVKEVAQMRELASQGKSSKETAKALGRTHGATKYKAMVEGIRFTAILQPVGTQLRVHHAETPSIPPDTGGSLTVNGMTLTPELVTPELAKEWLGRNQCNRRLRPDRVELYTRDMRAGRWLIKPFGICFDTEGRLGNGQHTLSAIVASGAAQWLVVARAVPRPVIATLDRGIMRSTADIAKFLGVDTSNTAVSTARLMAFGIDATITTDLQLAAVQLYEEAISWAMARIRGKGLKNAPLIAAVAKAWFHEDRDRLEQFCNVLVDGVSEGDADSAAVRLRETARAKGALGGQDAREDMHYKAIGAVAAFLARKPMSKLYATGKEPFKYPRLEDTEVQS